MLSALKLRMRGLRISRLSTENRNIAYLTIDTAFQGLVMGGIFGFISVFVVRLGASNLVVSLVTSLPAIVMALCSIPAGRLTERQVDLVRYTNRIRAFHRGSFLLVALLPFFVHGWLAEVVVVVWAAKSIAAALLQTSWMAVVARMIPPERRARVNGTRWAIVSVVTAMATAVFGYILDRLPFPLSYLEFTLSRLQWAFTYPWSSPQRYLWGGLLQDSLPIQREVSFSPRVSLLETLLWASFSPFQQF